MKIAIIGTGGIGGYYGAKLAYAGNDVHFLLRSDYDAVAQRGLEIDSCNGSFTIPHPNIYRSTADMPQADIIVVGLKTTANSHLAELLTPIMKPTTLVLLIQNGIGVEADAQKLLPEAQLLAGLAFICTTKTAPGHITHTSNGSINIGNYSCHDAAAMARIMQMFTEAGVRVAEVEYEEARWRKAVWNMPFNGLTVALGLQTDQLLNTEAGEQLVRQLMAEVLGAARACGVTTISDQFIDKMIDMTQRMPSYAPSMMVDWQQHRPMEIDYLYTRPIAVARQSGYDMTRLAMLEAQLRIIEHNMKLK